MGSSPTNIPDQILEEDEGDTNSPKSSDSSDLDKPKILSVVNLQESV